MVVMLRTLGIQARNVNGFLGGQWNEFGSYLVVTQNEAHSWVEVWFPGYGWVTFDPTPAGGGEGAVVSAWFWPGRILFDGIQHRWNKWVLDYSVDDQVGIFSGLLGERTRDQLTGPAGPVDEDSGPSPWAAVAILVGLAAGLYWARGLGGPAHDPPTRMYLQLRQASTRAGVGVSPGLTPLALVDRIGEKIAARSDRRATPRAEGRAPRLAGSAGEVVRASGAPDGGAVAKSRCETPSRGAGVARGSTAEGGGEAVAAGGGAGATRGHAAVATPTGGAAPAARVVDLYLRARYGGQELGDSELREMREALAAARRLLRSGG